MCLECPVVQPAPPSGEHSSVDLCADCLADPAIAHVGEDATAHVDEWLRVDGATGAYVVGVAREAVRGAAVGVVGAADLAIQPHTPGEECSVCYCVEFSDAEPKRAPPGCADPAHGWCALARGCGGGSAAPPSAARSARNDDEPPAETVVAKPCDGICRCGCDRRRHATLARTLTAGDVADAVARAQVAVGFCLAPGGRAMAHSAWGRSPA